MFHSETNLANTDYRENRSMILSGLSLWEKGSPLHKSTQQVRTQGPIRHADCRQRKLADFLCTGGIIQGLIRRASVASGNGTALIVGCGATALFDLHTTHFPAKFAPHISLSINGFVTETIVFFYICLNLFLRYLWLTLAFSAVRFSVHGINRSDIHLFLRFFSLNE
ncbi:hypothetical protein [Escherichia coli]|uniref:hypothetical protein n=1 Tax=Escherichia coli TaxID=562 RepID=UPI002237BBA2|nr:hypothetical protein [Escherichia coli]MCW7099964.1 hypothetical protein [Escherichia coli]